MCNLSSSMKPISNAFGEPAACAFGHDVSVKLNPAQHMYSTAGATTSYTDAGLLYLHLPTSFKTFTLE